LNAAKDGLQTDLDKISTAHGITDAASSDGGYGTA